ncbi:ABC transporter permease [Niabella beijingensis]|uniref:ABC transporter permease n=1 Tax=Niabella beijingensis TaxID=2872700 RepID=UPI001CBA7758|nr:ABC transporter permease [Niabella beijingensis]MBZ4188434.1 ABC transporter permease [Niabella beijingensis]
MLQLFKTEWLKVKSYRTFWILFGSFFIFLPATLLMTADRFMHQINQMEGKNMETAIMKSLLSAPFIFPNVWRGAAWFGGLFFIIIGMLFILLVTNEVQYKTHRQNIIDGWSRTDFITAKLSMLLFFVVSTTVMVFLCGLVCGLLFTPDLSSVSIFENIRYVGYYALMATLYLVVAFLVAILIKRTGLAIVVYFGYVFVIDNLLWLVLTFRKSQLGYFLPLESSDSLIPNPFKPSNIELRTVPDLNLLITAVIYGTLMLYGIFRYYRNADLKT